MLGKLDNSEAKQSEAQKKHASRLLKRIKFFDAELMTRAKKWDKAVEFVNGNPDDDGKAGLVRTNIVAAKLDSVQTNIYAKSPEIACIIDENLNTEVYPTLKPFAKTLEIALNEYFVKGANLKARGKEAVKLSQTSTVAWFKLMYQNDVRTDAFIQNRINDTQDNIERIKRLVEETESVGGKNENHDAELFELNQIVSSLEKQVEVSVSQGLVVDLINPKDLIILDAGLKQIGDYKQASCIVHRVKMSVAKFKDKYKKEPPEGTNYYNAYEMKEKSGGDGDDRLICLFEAWSLDELSVYTLIEGYEGYVEAPKQPETLGKQWYPFFPLQLRQVTGIKYPYSTAELVMELGHEYNHKRTSDADHKRKNKPVRVFNKDSGITDEEIKALNNRSSGDEVIGISADPNLPLQNQIGHYPEIPYNPQMYDTSQVLFDIEIITGAQDAASGSVRVEKTAREAEILSAGQQGRVAEMIDIIEDCFAEMATYAAELLLQNVSAEEIMNKFGDKSVWPSLDKKSLFDMVNITIRAGSTARPNKGREREQWIQLMPNIEKMVLAYSEAKSSGNETQEKVALFLLEETFKRFDEKLDVKAILGMQDEDGEETQEQQLPPEMIEQAKVMQAENDQLKQIAQQAQQQLQTMQAENDKLASQNDLLKAGNDVKMREIDLKNREVDIKTQDLNNQTLETDAIVEEKQLNMDAVTNLINQSAMIANSVSDLVANVTKEPEYKPKIKRGRVIENLDGTMDVEIIEQEIGE